MKTKFIAGLCLLLSLSVLCSFPAFATSNELETIVVYTKNGDVYPGEDDPSTDSGTSRPVYEIAIPAEKDLARDGSALPIHLTENNIPDGYMLNVYIDSAKTFGSDGFLHLTGAKGQDDALAYIFRYNSDGSAETFWNEDLPKVAAFDSESKFPVEYGTLQFQVVNEDEIEPDTYTGRVYFRLEISAK